MNGVNTGRQTLYSEHILEYVNIAKGMPDNLMTIGQFAIFARVRLTHNLRTRLWQLHRQGVIQLRQSYDDYNTLQYVIHFDVPEQYKLPF